MKCDDASERLHPYADGELDAITASEIERHLDSCEICSSSYNELKSLKGAIAGLYYRAPIGLGRRVISTVSESASISAPDTAIRTHRWTSNAWRDVAIAASILLLLVASWLLIINRAQPGMDSVASEIIDNHIRSLMANHLMDVPSTDQHTVKPWFNGKVDFAPNVVDLSPDGFALVGGRLDYANGHPAAAMIYQRRQHYINLFEWPSSKPDEDRKDLSSRGYNLIYWRHAGMEYWAASDMNKNELSEFAADFFNASM